MAPVFGYWGIRGLAQPIRLILAQAEVDYEDKRYSDRESWASDKFNLGLDFPNLPYYIDGNLKLSQSMTILKYLARKHGLDGTNEDELIRLDLASGVWSDLKSQFTRMCYSPDFEKLKVDFLKTLPTQIKQIGAYLGKNSWIAGEKLTYVDFLYYELLDILNLFDPSCLNDYQNLKDYLKRFESLPNIAAYMKTDKFIKNPINGYIAFWGQK